MHADFDFDKLVAGQTVYVRSVRTADLPEKLRKKVPGQDIIYAVHRTNGDRVALVKDRSLAFVLARRNNLAPVTVH